MKIKIMIVDDQRLMREGLKTILDLENDMEVIQLAADGKDALEKLADNRPDVILMDIRMPVMDGVECTRIVKEKHPGIKVLILTTFDDDVLIIDALKNGAAGYILKDLSSDKLVSSIRDVFAGDSIMQPEIAAKLIRHITGMNEPADMAPAYKNCSEELTGREKDVLRLVGKGLTNSEIAGKLYISEGTVKNYISVLYDKTGINDRSKLTLYAIDNNYI